ncbi:hypothetical protein BDZ91DRAFT_791306 [Kalaharituber pfeilii]|nr:hypothetical protein BDZ91DRAFT_791306 [Kalaharituber pfeilii]
MDTTAAAYAGAPFNLSVLQSPLFKITLDDGSAYYIHKELLASLSAEWRQHTDNEMKEGLTGEMLLREVDNTTLQRFLQWVYFREYTIDELKDPGSALLIYAKLYALADRFNVQELKAFNFGKLKALLKKRQVDQPNFTPTMVLAAARYAVDTLPNYLQPLRVCLFVQEYPNAAVALFRLTSHTLPASKLSTVNIHAWDQKNSKACPVHWTKINQAQRPLPSLAFALTGFDAPPDNDIQLSASYQWVEKGLNPTYNAILDSGETLIRSAACSWLEIPSDHPVLRTGTYNMTEALTFAGGPKTIPIQFSQPFTRKAKVILFLNGMNFNKKPASRINMHAIDATANGFTLKLETWMNTIVLKAGVTWVAYPEGTLGITSGVVSTSALRTCETPQPKNAWYHSFVGEVAFGSTPKIFLGLNGLDLWGYNGFRLATEVVNGPETNKYGFMWRADTWGDTIMYTTWLAYLAFDPNL